MKKKSFTTMPTFVIFSVAMLAMSFASYSYDPMLCYIEIAVSVVTAGIVVVSTLRFRNYIATTVRNFLINTKFPSRCLVQMAR